MRLKLYNDTGGSWKVMGTRFPKICPLPGSCLYLNCAEKPIVVFSNMQKRYSFEQLRAELSD